MLCPVTSRGRTETRTLSGTKNQTRWYVFQTLPNVYLRRVAVLAALILSFVRFLFSNRLHWENWFQKMNLLDGIQSKKCYRVNIVIYRQMFDKIADWSWLCYHDLICLVNFTFLVSRKNHIPLFSSIRLSGKDTLFLRYNWVQYVVLFYFSHAERYAAQRMSRMSVNQVLARYLQLCMSFILGKNKHLIN